MGTHMASVNISLKKEAYEFLKSLKKKDESFSEVILTFKEQQRQQGNVQHILRLAGGLQDKKIDWNARKKRMADFRKSVNERLARQTKRDV